MLPDDGLSGWAVEVRLGQAVGQIDKDGVIVGGERIASRTVIWTAGVAASPAGKWLAVGDGSFGTGEGAGLILACRGIRRFSWWAIPPRSSRTESRCLVSLRLRCSRDAMQDG